MTYRSDLDALSARQTALETEVRDRTRELDAARRLVEEIEARARLPVLDNIRVAAPCSARWDRMTGDDRVRACGDCNKNVYNLSDMTRDEAESLIREKEGRLCVRYFQRADGTILLKDCSVGVKRRRRRRVVAAGVAASLAGSVLAYELRSPFQRMVVTREAPVMGEFERPVMGRMVSPPPAAPAQAPVQPDQFITGTVDIHDAREVIGDLDSVERPRAAPRPRRAGK